MKAVEFFCGAGGTSTGLERAGIKILHAYDYWYPALRVYRKNVSFRAFAKDIKDVFWLGQSVARQKVEIIVGSPPCQDFSTVGQRRESLNARLTHAYGMLVAIARPEWFLMENVPEAARSKAWKESRAILVRQGYGLTEMILNAKDCGTPQSRKRLIVIGRLEERNGFLLSSLTDAASAKPMTVRDMLRPDEFPEDKALLDVMYFYMRPYSGNPGVFSIDRPSPTIIRTATAPPGPTYRKHPHPEDPFPVAQAHVMTREQVSRLQGFPAGWDWSLLGNKNNVEQGIANAVPPPLAEAVAKVILARHHGEMVPAVESGFVEWLSENGKSDSAASNVKANVNRARKLLKGRTFADPALEMGRLELADGFGSLPTQTKSDLRSALRLHAEWQADASSKRSSA